MRSGERVGILLVNTGTAAAPRVAETRAFLREFLSDPRVLDMSRPLRWLLLHGIILPFRPKRSAEAYRRIWTDKGSPLLTAAHDLQTALRERMPEAEVEIGMRHGEPSMAAGLEALVQRGTDRILVAPLFPHYASATVGSVTEHAYALAGKLWTVPPLSILTPFYDKPEFLDAWAAVAKPELDGFGADHVLMSFHGLPERHVRKGDPTGKHCLMTQECCEKIGPENRNCYRAQCVATARSLAKRLGLGDNQHSMAFQSRLGRDPWLGPATSAVLPELTAQGVKRLAILCPSFTADCLETLDEIAHEARNAFLDAGGEAFLAVPCLNGHPVWADGLAKLLADL